MFTLKSNQILTEHLTLKYTAVLDQSLLEAFQEAAYLIVLQMLYNRAI